MSRKLRILCLHGFRTSAKILTIQCGHFKHQLSELAEFTFIDGLPATGPTFPEVANFFKPPYFEWWSASDDKKTYNGVEETLRNVRNVWATQGPFDGILGFSQGGVLTTVLTAIAEKGAFVIGGGGEGQGEGEGEGQKEVEKIVIEPKPKFVIIVASFVPNAEVFSSYFTEPLATPSLHIAGTADPMFALSESLRGLYQHCESIEHTGGHIVPSLSPTDIARVKAFLSQFQQASL